MVRRCVEQNVRNIYASHKTPRICAYPTSQQSPTNANMALRLPPLPQPGLNVYPGFIATKPETFVAKGRDSWSDKASYLISFSSPTGEALAPFLEIVEQKRNQISFKTMQGQEVMRIVKQKHAFSGTEYHGMRGDGKEIWYLKLKSGLTKTEYRKSEDPSSNDMC